MTIRDQIDVIQHHASGARLWLVERRHPPAKVVEEMQAIIAEAEKVVRAVENTQGEVR